VLCMNRCHRRLTGLVAGLRHARRRCLWARPTLGTHAAGTGRDLRRTRAHLVAENAFLRQHLLVRRRGVTRPLGTAVDRTLLVLLAGRVRAWQQALLRVQPDTLLRWHRAGRRAMRRPSP